MLPGQLVKTSAAAPQRSQEPKMDGVVDVRVSSQVTRDVPHNGRQHLQQYICSVDMCDLPG